MTRASSNTSSGFASAISVMVLIATLVLTAIVWRVTGFGREG